MKTKIILGLVAVVAVIGCFMPFGGTTVVEKVVGAAAGPDVYNRTYFYAGLTAGGTTSTTTTAATYTTVAKDFAGLPTVWKVTPNIITTFSISSTSTLDYIPKVGDVAVIYIENASSTAAGTITLAAASTNLDLQKNEDVADLAIAGLDYARITLIRKGTYDVTAIYDNYVVAD